MAFGFRLGTPFGGVKEILKEGEWNTAGTGPCRKQEGDILQAEVELTDAGPTVYHCANVCLLYVFHVCLLCVSVVAIDRCVYHLSVDVSVNACLSVLCVVCVSHVSAHVSVRVC